MLSVPGVSVSLPPVLPGASLVPGAVVSSGPASEISDDVAEVPDVTGSFEQAQKKESSSPTERTRSKNLSLITIVPPFKHAARSKPTAPLTFHFSLFAFY